MRFNRCKLLIPGLFLITAAMGAQTQVRDDARADTMRWFQKARFGMFVHWSIASVAGLEGSWPMMLPGAMPKLGNVTDAEYRDFAKRFNPNTFDDLKTVSFETDYLSWVVR